MKWKRDGRINWQLQRKQCPEKTEKERMKVELIESVNQLNENWNKLSAVGEHMNNELMERDRMIGDMAKAREEVETAQAKEAAVKVEIVGKTQAVQEYKERVGKRMPAWEDQAVQISKKAKRVGLGWGDLSVEMMWNGESVVRLGSKAGVGSKMRAELREELGKQKWQCEDCMAGKGEDRSGG